MRQMSHRLGAEPPYQQHSDGSRRYNPKRIERPSFHRETLPMSLQDDRSSLKQASNVGVKPGAGNNTDS